ncbi:MAG: fibronectin type III domain-containing protein, partial [Bacteroidales bacterium]|nr:fibronectin type III domain-containing protein [Bacteroidales bacterium]
LQWTWGTWWMENGVTVLDPDGNMVYTVAGMWNHDSTLTTFTASCPFVSPMVVTDSAGSITQTEATLHGHIADMGELPIVTYGFEWKPLFATDFNVVTVTGDSLVHSLSGLAPSTDYLYRAFATTAVATTYGNEIVFTTLDEVIPPCPAPTNLHVTDSSDNTLSIAWTETGDAEEWNIQYRAGNGEMSSDVSYQPSYLITDLLPNTAYQIQVQSLCGIQTSDWTPTVTARTTNTGIADYDRYVRVYPNPAGDVIHVECTMYNVQLSGTIEVVDVYGKTVHAVVGANNDSPLRTRINVSNLAPGVYFVRIALEEGVVTKAFVKN